MVASTSFPMEFVARMAVVTFSSFIASTDPPSSVAEESTFATTIMVVVAPVMLVVLEQPTSRHSELVVELVFTLQSSF